MLARHVVVDGSNIATEGRSLPSLGQLEEAVKEYRKEFPDDLITVVVDATFGHRIPEDERRVFDDAVAHNEVVSPPAGAIGRGDAFLLTIAEKVHATVLSNDSFQEFHGEHAWLFDHGRLIGAKPVPGVGWIFTPRTPVRGPRSRESTRAARGGRKPQAEEQQQRKVQKAIAAALEEAVEPNSASARRRRRRRGGSPPADPVNAPLAFIEFVAAHPLGSPVEGEVESFSSHGAFVDAAGARCYIPLSALGNPPPRAAKDVLRKGENRTFVLQALDPPRRGIELALPEFARVSGEPTPETVEDEISQGAPVARRGRRRKAAEPVEVQVQVPVPVPRTKAARKKAAEPAPVAEPVAEPRPRKRAARAKAAAEVVAPPAVEPSTEAPPPKRAARKKAAAQVVAPSTEAPPPPKRAARKKAAAQVVAPPVEPPPPKRAARKKAAAQVVAPPVEPPPPKRAARKKAAAEVVAPPVEPPPPKRAARKKAAAEVVAPPVEPPPPKRAARKKAAAEVVAPRKTPAKRAAKKPPPG